MNASTFGIRIAFWRSALAAFAVASAALPRAVDAAPTPASAAALPTDVKIPAELTQQVTSLTARVGDTFTFKTVKDETLGALLIPAGTPGHGRVAVATPAHDRAQGTMSLQADSLDLPDGRTIAVNIDASKPIRGRLSDSHTRFNVLPIPIGVIPIARTTRSGNLVLEPGTTFTVITTLPRSSPAPLLTASPPPVPDVMPTAAAAGTPRPAPSAGATP